MKKFINSIIVIAMVGLLFNSCTVEKRLYNRGYYVAWKHSYKGGEEVKSEITEEKTGKEELQIAELNSSQSEESVMVTVDNNSEVTANTINFSFEEKTSAVVSSDENKLNRDNSIKSEDVTSLNVVNKKTKSEKLSRPVLKKVSKAETKSSGPSRGVLFILCFLIPWLAVGLATDWDLMPLVFNLLWSLTCIGGIIHALIVVNREA